MLKTRAENLLNFDGQEERSRYKRQNGFTLAEILLVLFAFLLLLSVMPPLFISLWDSVEEKHFLKQFETDLLMGQQFAISRRETVTFTYRLVNRSYEIKGTGGKVLIVRYLPEDFRIRQGDMNQFQFKANGNITKFGNMIIETKDKFYQVFFSIGKGRFEISEIERHN